LPLITLLSQVVAVVEKAAAKLVEMVVAVLVVFDQLLQQLAVAVL
jgi:hypothetical protein